MLRGQGRLFAYDIDQARLRHLEAGAKRVGLSVRDGVTSCRMRGWVVCLGCLNSHKTSDHKQRQSVVRVLRSEDELELLLQPLDAAMDGTGGDGEVST